MTTFSERERGFEGKFEHDQELAFKARARRNKLLGLWAAEQLGLSGDAAQRYAREVLAADLQHPGVGDIIAKLKTDFAKHGIAHDETRIRVELERWTTEAMRQLDIKG
jgi:hypothetical protein